MLLTNRVTAEPPPTGAAEPVTPKFDAEVVVPVPVGVAPVMGVEGVVTGDRTVPGDRPVPRLAPGPMGDPPVLLAILRVYPRMAFCACGRSSLLAMKRAIWACRICKPAARIVKLLA